MRQRVEGLPHHLEAEVIENGDNFSAGERQLLCMARALLRSNKILILDEATASMDPETDRLVQETIQGVFRDCTVLTIAHRVQSVLSCDRVLVLKDGRAVEFDVPSVLLANKKSIFASMIPDLPSN
jgi:ATP-binding cassette subfamily C (CFTR/MRP) protein 5